MYRYTTNVYRYMRLVFGQKVFLTQNFVPLDIPNPPPLYTKPNPNLFAFSHKHPQVRLPLPEFPSLRFRFSCILRTDVVSFLKLFESIFVPSTSIHGVGWLSLCSGFLYLVVWGLGRKLLSDMHGASPVLFETSFWDFIIYIWAIWAIIAILVISMARSKNIGKGKAPSSSMERAVKKRKSDSSQPVKKGKGKQIESSSESDEVLESDDDDEIEAMFVEGSESE